MTDHSWLHGELYDAISAKQWAFNDANNPYSWLKALEYYKKAMEIPEDAKITVVPGTGFRDPDIPVSSTEQARNVYLGKAFRALGETMHMMADLTQPAHVRNDSHPNGDLDPIESTANRNTVLLVKDRPVDPEAEKDLAAASECSWICTKIWPYTPTAIFILMIPFTIEPPAVNPRNWENPYPHPQFSATSRRINPLAKNYVKNLTARRSAWPSKLIPAGSWARQSGRTNCTAVLHG